MSAVAPSRQICNQQTQSDVLSCRRASFPRYAWICIICEALVCLFVPTADFKQLTAFSHQIMKAHALQRRLATHECARAEASFKISSQPTATRLNKAEQAFGPVWRTCKALKAVQRSELWGRVFGARHNLNAHRARRAEQLLAPSLQRHPLVVFALHLHPHTGSHRYSSHMLGQSSSTQHQRVIDADASRALSRSQSRIWGSGWRPLSAATIVRNGAADLSKDAFMNDFFAPSKRAPQSAAHRQAQQCAYLRNLVNVFQRHCANWRLSGTRSCRAVCDACGCQ